MLTAFRSPTRLLAGFIAAALTITPLPLASPTWATDGIDKTVTGSISPDGEASSAKGSAAFRSALDLLAKGEHQAAYDLAKSLPSDLERRTIQWGAIYYGGGDIDYDSVVRFSADAPDFAGTSVFKTRLEQALIKAAPGGSETIHQLGGSMPNTIDAQVALALAYVEAGKRERAESIARAIWTEDFLDRESEDKVFARLGQLIDPAAHWARAVHLMMHDRASAVERLLPFMTEPQKSLALARNAVSRNGKDARKLLDGVDKSLQSHPVFLFSRAQRARQFELWDDAIAWLDQAKGDAPDAEEFWYERRTLIRQLLGKNDAKRAYTAAARYTDGPEGRLVEARFHAGWIALSFLREPGAAVQQFTAMAKLSSLPDSLTQANYWLGRAMVAAGNLEGAAKAYQAAGQYGTLYYGLLARAELGQHGVELRGLPEWKSSEPAFNSRDLVQAVNLLADNGHKDMAVPLLRSFAFGLKTGGELLLAARLAQRLDAHHLAISIADTAERRGFPLDLFNFPKDGLPADQFASVDKAAVYAIARQESKFQVDAMSSVGARGLMQLMPETAKETAKKVGVEYSRARLTSDPAYNTMLGATYLANQLNNFSGSLVLAAAAYNAGAGNAKKWIAAFGDPREANVDTVIWVELIPFQETRKYVQRVLGNYLVYRARLGDSDMSMFDALKKIPG